MTMAEEAYTNILETNTWYFVYSSTANDGMVSVLAGHRDQPGVYHTLYSVHEKQN